MDSVITLKDTILTISADTNVSWSCKVDGNVFLSKYNGIGNDTINIYYSSINPFAEIYFLPHNECLSRTQIINFPLNDENINSFYADPSFIKMKSGNEYTIYTDSQYGIDIIKDNDLINLSTNTLEKGKNSFIVSGANADIDGYVILTEKYTNSKLYIHVTQSLYKNNNFLYVFDSLGNNIPNNGTISWSEKETYFKIRTNSYITNISSPNNFIIKQLDNFTFQVNPINYNNIYSENITITNINNDNITINFYFGKKIN